MWFDAGVNLTNPRLLERLEQVLEQAAAAQVRRLVVIATNVAHSRTAIELCERFPDRLQTTVGVHPHDAAGAGAEALAELRDLAQHPAVCAIGECGLDFNRNFSPPAIQLQVFRAQLELAALCQLPAYLHERDAYPEQLQLLREFRADIPKLFSHCFTGDSTQLAGYQALDCYIGITGWVCDERRGEALQNAVGKIAANRLILETDAPYLVPRHVRPRPALNQPNLLPEIAEVVAALRQQTVAELAQQVWQNSLELFGSDGWQNTQQSGSSGSH